MGYNTYLQGPFKFSEGRKLNEDQYLYLLLSWQVPRYKRTEMPLEGYPDPIRGLVGLPLGPEGAFFVSSKEFLALPTELQVNHVELIRTS